jgi:hypothetical protein
VASDLTWTTNFKGENPSQDTEPITTLQPNPSTQQSTDVTKALENATNYSLYLEQYLQSQLKTLRDKLRAVARIIWGQNVPVRLRNYAKASLPSATTAGQLIYVTDDIGGAVPAFSDGTNWRRVTDRVVIS